MPRHPPCALKNLATQKPHTHPRKEASARTYTNPVLQSQKMLASTVQFSTYDQTPPTRPRQTHALPQEAQRYEKQDGPDMRSTVARSLRTQQRAYGRSATGDPRSTHTEVCSTSGRRRRPAELVSVPPSSTIPGTRGPLGSSGPSCPGHGSGPDTSRGGRPQCSLERR